MVLSFILFLWLGVCNQMATGDLCYSGKEFLVVAPIIYPHNSNHQFNITVFGKSNTIVTVQNQAYHENKTIGQDEHVVFQFSYGLHAIEIQPIPFSIEKKSLRVTSTTPVGVYVSSDRVDGYTAVAESNGLTYMTSSYIVNGPCYSYFAVAAFHDFTEIKIELRINENVHEAQFWNSEYTNNDKVTEVIHAHDVYLVYGYNDITGTKIIANQSVSVFSGVNCLENCVRHGNEICKAFIEQMLPVNNFASDTITFRIPDLPKPTYFRAIALKQNTAILIPGEQEEILVNVGNFAEWNRSPPYQDMYLAFDVLPVQFYSVVGSDLHPLHTTLTPTVKFAVAHKVLALKGYNTQVVMITANSSTDTYSVMMDGVRLVNVRVDVVHSKYRAIVVAIPEGVHTLWFEDERLTAVYVYEYGSTANNSFHGACWDLNHPDESSQITDTVSKFTAVTESVFHPIFASNTDPGTTEWTSILQDWIDYEQVTDIAESNPSALSFPNTHPAGHTETTSVSGDNTHGPQFTPFQEGVSSFSTNRGSVESITALNDQTSIPISTASEIIPLPEFVTSAYMTSYEQTTHLQGSHFTPLSERSSTKTNYYFSNTESQSLLDTNFLFPSQTLATETFSTTLTTTFIAISAGTETSGFVAGSFSESTFSGTLSTNPSASLWIATDSMINSPLHSQYQNTCSLICAGPINTTTISSAISQLKNNLTLDKDSLGQFVRKRISAQDDRPIAQSFGYVGIIVIVSSVFCLVLGDLCSVVRSIKEKLL